MAERINKTKDQIAEDIVRQQKVAHIKDIVRRIFPLLEVPTIYDAQTTLNALVGFIKADLEEKTQKVKVGDISIDLSKESEITTAIKNITDLFLDEPAEEFAQTLDRLSKAFGDYGSMRFVKNPMTEIKVDDLVAE